MWEAIWLFFSGHPVILILALFVFLLISIFGNIGINLKDKKFTFGQQKQIKFRSCSDCIRLLMAKRTAFESIYYIKQNSILRQQMLYAENKLVEIETILGKLCHPGIKDEIRRSFKDNGFSVMPDENFKKYIEDRKEILFSMLNIPTNDKISYIIKEIYCFAKDVRINLEEEIKRLEENFKKEIDDIGNS
jgi:hypothetical protein